MGVGNGGRPITQGGCDHSSHRLVFLGLSERRAVWTLYGMAARFSVLAVGLRLLNVYLTLAVAGMGTVVLALVGAFSAHVEVMEPEYEDGRSDVILRGGVERGVPLRAVLRHKREVALLVADLLLMTASFVVAHYLRFEAGLSQDHLDRMVKVLPGWSW